MPFGIETAINQTLSSASTVAKPATGFFQTGFFQNIMKPVLSGAIDFGVQYGTAALTQRITGRSSGTTQVQAVPTSGWAPQTLAQQESGAGGLPNWFIPVMAAVGGVVAITLLTRK